jgi:hypothetical protein
MEDKLPPCEVCGGISVCMVFDLESRGNLDLGVMELKPKGDPHYFCLEHKRKSFITELGSWHGEWDA